MPLSRQIARFLADRDLHPERILVAVSGGRDSAALLVALTELEDRSFDVVAGHVNHGLRGEDSDLDEAWVRELARRIGLECLAAAAPLDPEAVRARGVEAAARIARYEALERIRREAGADLIATAHQMNDQAETVLMRLISGSGVDRLRGVLPVTERRVIRPMLDVSRQEIDRFLDERSIEPRHDRMNVDPRFLRSRIRYEILPLLEELNPNVVRTLAQTARLAREETEVLEEMTRAATGSWVRGENQTAFAMHELPESAWLREELLLREMRRLDPEGRDVSRSSLIEIVRALPTLSRRTVSRDLELIKRGDRIILRKMLPSGVAFDEAIALGVDVELPVLDASLRLERLDSAEEPYTNDERSRQVFQIPDRIAGGLRFRVRSRRPGDRFHPLGLYREKKLNEFLIGRKIPVEERDRLPLLTCDEEIVWVAGVEVSERYKVTDPDGAAFLVSVAYHGDDEDSEGDSL